ncbi:major facilitator superfamily domain-containing protein 10 isoform X2 [Drosophila ficusphila]|uniref:major facilitator superfamily domain-containing protein 10 isoform X2 n=1 Tax=Drosophila ficusphila TaxID=30025 RepID=UPI001C8B087D|nr:major facilitator superfamily domain-containing protein 10 isoform X2 [Drosophila ficusphila]
MAELRSRHNGTNSVVKESQATNHNNNKFDKEPTKNGKPEKGDPMIYIIFVSLLFDLLAFTIILPLLPSLLEYYRKNDSSGLYDVLTDRVRWFQQLLGAPERYISVLFGGFLGSMFSFLQFVASPIVGGLSDYYGRKPVLLVCASGIALSYLIWACSSNFALFVLARFVGGISKGNISLCMSVITDVSSVKTRGRGMALVGVAFSLGFIVGPMIGALFAIFSDKSGGSWFVLPSLLAFGLAIGDLLVLACCLRETLPKEKRVKEISSALSYGLQLLNFSAIFRFAAIKNVPKKDIESLRSIGLIYFLYLFLYSGLEFTVTFLMYHKFGYTSMDQAKMFLTTGIIMTLLQGSVVRRLPEAKIKGYAIFSLYLIVPAFVLVGLAEGSRMLYAGMTLFAISTAFAVTCLTTLVSKYGNDDQKGSVLGIFRSLGALARALGPVVGCIGERIFCGIVISF